MIISAIKLERDNDFMGIIIKTMIKIIILYGRTKDRK